MRLRTPSEQARSGWIATSRRDWGSGCRPDSHSTAPDRGRDDRRYLAAARNHIRKIAGVQSKTRVARFGTAVYRRGMDLRVISALRRNTASIQSRWTELLHVERFTTPLANPDMLEFLVPQTIEQALSALADQTLTLSLAEARLIRRPNCDCGLNPYQCYFVAGEQAMMEALVLVQAHCGDPKRRDFEAAALISVIRSLAAVEIEAFCGVCTSRVAAAGCRHEAMAF